MIVNFIFKRVNVDDIKKKSQQKLINTQQKVIKSGKTQQKPIKKQHILLKEKIDGIRKKLNEVHHNLPKSELKEIKKYLYNIEKKNY